MSDKKGKYIVVDTETTGLLVGINGICEIAAAVLDKDLEIIDTISFDVNPGNKKINEESLKINHFTLERIAAGLNYSESCAKLSIFVRQYFDDTPTYIAQFFPFDYSFLNDMFVSCNMEDECQFLFKNKFIDTKSIAIFANLRAETLGNPLPFARSTSLSNPGGIKEIFDIKGHESHTALGDVLATREALIHLLKM